MEIIFKSHDSEFIKTLSFRELETFQSNLGEFFSVKETLQVIIFAINETLNSYELKNIKMNLNELKIKSLHLYSNKRETILSGRSLKINSTFLREKDLKDKLFSSSQKSKEDIIHKGTIRSGDRISSNGDLFIVGDVNPGAIVSAKKNVIVWGKLLGVALAGEGGNEKAIIASLYLNPLQLRIADIVAIGPKDKRKNYYPEVAHLEKETIIIRPHIIKTNTFQPFEI